MGGEALVMRPDSTNDISALSHTHTADRRTKKKHVKGCYYSRRVSSILYGRV